MRVFVLLSEKKIDVKQIFFVYSLSGSVEFFFNLSNYLLKKKTCFSFIYGKYLNVRSLFPHSIVRRNRSYTVLSSTALTRRAARRGRGRGRRFEYDVYRGGRQV